MYKVKYDAKNNNCLKLLKLSTIVAAKLYIYRAKIV